MTFVWDEAKNSANIAKHGLSFETASCVFDDENRVELYDSYHSINEDRYITIGYVNEIIYVVYTCRQKYTRIISARKANVAERRLYYGYYL
ncbi:MAG: BrnT family toxin [Lachnospiraceae bacterium]|nr:BrnT family toxin [Lachnospiraceae bacterium]